MKITLNIKNESILTPLLWMLKHFENDGLEIEQKTNINSKKLTDKYIAENWQKLIITHENPIVNDKENLIDAHGEWYSENN